MPLDGGSTGRMPGQMPQQLTPEREAKIRKNATQGQPIIRDLLAEIDRLRAEVEYWVNKAARLSEDRDKLSILLVQRNAEIEAK